MSGIEVAGLVLAILPIAIEGLKASKEGIYKVASHKKHTNIKRKVYNTLLRELIYIIGNLKDLFGVLPGIPKAQQQDLLSRPDWKPEQTVIDALKLHLGEEAFGHFELAVLEIYTWMVEICQTRSVKVNGVEDQTNIQLVMLSLKSYNESLRKLPPASAFRERFEFWRKQGQLEEQTKEVTEWRKFLEWISRNNQGQKYRTSPISSALPSVGQKSSRPYNLPNFSRTLHEALSRQWSCSHRCPVTHQAKISLQFDPGLHQRNDPKSVEYHLAFSTPHSSEAQRQWQESQIVVFYPSERQPPVAQSAQGKSRIQFQSGPWHTSLEFESVCAVMREKGQKQGIRLCFEVHHFEESLQTSIYRIGKVPSEFGFEWNCNTTTLNEAFLEIQQMLDLSKKRELALMLVYGLLTLADTPWLRPQWTKQNISFFRSHNDTICLRRPFLSGGIGDDDGLGDTSAPDICHPIPDILSLGILLLELETGKPIELMRIEADYHEGAGEHNTNFFAAHRAAMAATMSSTFYKEAVLACLSAKDWLTGYEKERTLSDKGIQKMLYERVVEKLEAELESMNPKIC